MRTCCRSEGVATNIKCAKPHRRAPPSSSCSGSGPRILESPLPVETAVDHVSDWLAQPNARFLLPGARHLEIAFDLLRTLGTAGNLTTDVQLAALAIEHKGELHSNDTDFGRFDDLQWVNPLR